MNDPLLIVAALNGMRSRAECPKVPLLPDELAAEAKRAVDAGAALVHVHARKPDGAPAFDLSYDDIVSSIRAAVDVPISITTQRTRQTSLGTITALFDVLRDPPDLATVNVRPTAPDLPAHREEARQILEACDRAGVRPEPTVVSLDSLADIETLYNDSLLGRAPYLLLEFGSTLAAGSERIAGTPQNVLRMAEAARAQFSRFPWVAFGEDEASPVVCAVAAAAGGHVRVGFEDTATLPDGSQASSNAQLVELAANVAESLGRPVMDPSEARDLLR
jgi:3-keto-5-aminohexanoate cleavage enzyme